MSTIQDIQLSVDLMKVLLWGQNHAAAIEGLVSQKEAWYTANQTDFWEGWYRDVFNIDTANRFGLVVWSIILNMDLSVSLDPTRLDKPTFGFGPTNKNFGHGNFGSKDSSTVGLSLDQARTLIKLRYLKLISRPTVPYVNAMLAQAFGDRGKVYVLDSLDMEYAIYVFDFEPGSQLRFLLEHFDILPRPAGVGIQYRVLTRKVFGFGPTNENFHYSTFYAKPTAG